MRVIFIKIDYTSMHERPTPQVNTSPSTHAQLVGNGYILLATIFFGLNIPAVKALVPRWMTAEDVTAVRIIAGCALMWLTALFVRRERIDRGDWLRLAAGGIVGLFSFMYLLNLSLSYADPIDVSIIMTLPPILVMLYRALIEHTRPATLECVGILTSFVGAALVILVEHGSAGTDNRLGELLALLSTLCYTFYLIVMQEPNRKYRSTTTLRWTFLFAAIPALLLTPKVAEAPLLAGQAGATPWAELIFILLGPTYFAYFLVAPANRLIGSELVSTYQYLTPVIAAIASAAMGIAKIAPLQIAAMAIIIAGMIAANLGRRRKT